jgi:hypothetical protein
MAFPSRGQAESSHPPDDARHEKREMTQIRPLPVTDSGKPLGPALRQVCWRIPCQAAAAHFLDLPQGAVYLDNVIKDSEDGQHS